MNLIDTQKSIRFCKGDFCVEAEGRNSEILTYALAFTVLCIGVAIIARSG